MFRWLTRDRGPSSRPPAADISRYAHARLLSFSEPHVTGNPVSPDGAALALLAMLGSQDTDRIGTLDVPDKLKMAASLEIAILQLLAVKHAASRVLGSSQLYVDLVANLDRHVQEALPERPDIAKLIMDRHAVYEASLRDLNPKRPGDIALRLGTAFCDFAGLDRDLTGVLSVVGIFESTRGAAQELVKRVLNPAPGSA